MTFHFVLFSHRPLFSLSLCVLVPNETIDTVLPVNIDHILAFSYIIIY